MRDDIQSTVALTSGVAGAARARGWTEENLVFIYSLPRSGSTLLQRMLATDPAVSTVSESWLLLPLFYALRGEGAVAEYGHRSAAGAIADFLGQVPGGASEYRQGVKRLAVSLFAQAARPGARLFVEKTPRYALIASELMETFAGSRHVFLWRNPLAIVASMIQTFGQGRWNLYKYDIDLYHGLESLLEAYAANASKVCALKYEDLVGAPREACTRVCRHLGLEFDERQLDALHTVDLTGRMGDPKRTQRSRPTVESLTSWEQVLSNVARKRWAANYLRWIGKDRLALMGYDLAELESRLMATPTRLGGSVSDLSRAAYGALDRMLELDLARRKWRARSGASRWRHY